MKKIENIVISETEPNTNSLWIHDGKLLYFDGGWKELYRRHLVIPDIPDSSASSRD